MENQMVGTKITRPRVREYKNDSPKSGFPLFSETTRSELASTRYLAEQFPVIAS